MNVFSNIWNRFISIGISEDLPLNERKITRLINVCLFFSIPSSLSFTIINIIKGYYTLAILNAMVAVGGILILLINKRRKYLIARMVLILTSIGVFSSSALLYNNGGEYYLVLNIVGTFILFKNRIYVFTSWVLNVLMFLFIRYQTLYEPHYVQVEYWRILFNAGWALTFIVLLLHYFKKEHISYQKSVEEVNAKLQQQQNLLIAQKEELEKQSQQLSELNKTKEKLFSVIAHDMRSPIGSLKGLLELMNEQVISKEEFNEVSRLLTNQVDNLYYNMDNLLHWTHTQMDGIEAEPKKIELKVLVNKCITLLQQIARQKQVQINLAIADDVTALADPNHIKLVVRNLLSNAIKFSYTGGTIEIGSRKKGSTIELYVSDSGTGMTRHQLSRLFDFKVASERGTANETGTGLGLALCKEFIAINHGSITVESLPGEGTTFIVSIPAYKEVLQTV